MKKRILEIVSALLLGVGSSHLYFLFSGYASALGLLRYVGFLPHSIRAHIYWSYVLILDVLYALPVIALTCFIGAYFIRHSARLYGALLFTGFLGAYIHSHIFIYSEFGFVGPIWMLISKGIIIAVLFIYGSNLVVSLKLRRLNRITKKVAQP